MSLAGIYFSVTLKNKLEGRFSCYRRTCLDSRMPVKVAALHQLHTGLLELPLDPGLRTLRVDRPAAIPENHCRNTQALRVKR